MATRDELPDLNVDDVQKEFDELRDKISALNRHLVGVGLDHLNKISGRLSDNDVIRLRDSIMQRLSALRYHLVLLIRVQESHVAHVQETGQDAGRYLTLYAEEQFALFDSLVFHSCSLFDYFGYLASFVCDNNNMKKRGWNSVIKSFRDPNNEMSNCFVASLMLDHHRDWVDKLYDYRSDLIHYKADAGGATTTWELMSGERDITVYAPQRFVSAMSELRKKSKDYHLTLRYVAFWLVTETVETAHEITLDLRKAIDENRKIPKHKQPIQVKEGNTKDDGAT